MVLTEPEYWVYASENRTGYRCAESPWFPEWNDIKRASKDKI